MDTVEPEQIESVSISVTREALVRDSSGRPALSLTLAAGDVKVALLPRNASARRPVRLEDLKTAVERLADAG